MRKEDARNCANLFVSRLMAVLESGQELGDPRSAGVIAAWSGICDGVPDALLKTLIPGTIRLLFRKPDIAQKLRACGLRESIALQHESIAPFVIAFRRLQTIRNGLHFDPEALLAEARQELRELNKRFYDILDQAQALQEETIRLEGALNEARDREKKALEREKASKREAAVAYNLLEDTKAKALAKLKLALEALRDALEKRLNDPDSALVSSASLSVQSYYMVLEDLGHGAEALKLSKKILGDKLGGMM